MVVADAPKDRYVGQLGPRYHKMTYGRFQRKAHLLSDGLPAIAETPLPDGCTHQGEHHDSEYIKLAVNPLTFFSSSFFSSHSFHLRIS